MSQATTGVIVIVVGLILLGRQLHMGLDIGRLWPLILIVLGVSKYLSVDAEGRRQNGVWLLLVGGLFLLNNFRILGIGDSWPVFIIAGGLALIFGRDRDRRARGRATNGPGAGDSANRVSNGSVPS
jgi:hypothetical protein